MKNWEVYFATNLTDKCKKDYRRIKSDNQCDPPVTHQLESNPNNVLENHLHRNKCPWKLPSGVIYRSKISTCLEQHLNWLQCLLHMSWLFGISSKQNAAGPWMQTDECTHFTYILTPKWSKAITIWISAHSFDWGWTIAVVHFKTNKQTDNKQTSKPSFVQASSQVNQTSAPLAGPLQKPVNIFNPPKHNSYS